MDALDQTGGMVLERRKYGMENLSSDSRDPA